MKGKLLRILEIYRRIPNDSKALMIGMDAMIIILSIWLYMTGDTFVIIPLIIFVILDIFFAQMEIKSAMKPTESAYDCEECDECNGIDCEECECEDCTCENESDCKYDNCESCDGTCCLKYYECEGCPHSKEME